MEAIDRVERGEIGGIVVAKLDRFGRSLLDGLAAIERIQDAGGTFASVEDGFDLSTNTGRLVLKLMLALGEWELERVRENFHEGRQRAVARGLHLAPVPNAGYRRGADGRLEPDPDHGETVTEIYRRAAEGESWASLARHAEQEGLRSAYGATSWTGRAIKELVRNRVYRGESHHGEMSNTAAHEALVDEATWERAQRIGKVSSPRSSRPALLAGVLRCASCRYGMRSEVTGGDRRYRCHKTFPGGRCSAPTYISGSSGIEEFVEQEFFDALGELRAAAQLDADRLDELERAYEEAEGVLAAYRNESRVIKTLGIESYLEGLAHHAERASEAREALMAERDRVDAVLPVSVTDLRSDWPHLEVTEKRRLLALAFSAVFVFPGRGPASERVHICLHGEEPDDLPRRGRRPAVAPSPFLVSAAV
jgi:DNA invertase Pin-like site-specific DNA recombinase